MSNDPNEYEEDSFENMKKISKELNFPFPYLIDETQEIAKKYGAIMPAGDIAFRATYIIDDKDVVQHMAINNLSVGRSVEEVARLVEAYQYTAKHGEVCPAGWTKGADSMKADPKGSQDYFKKL